MREAKILKNRRPLPIHFNNIVPTALFGLTKTRNTWGGVETYWLPKRNFLSPSGFNRPSPSNWTQGSTFSSKSYPHIAFLFKNRSILVPAYKDDHRACLEIIINQYADIRSFISYLMHHSAFQTDLKYTDYQLVSIQLIEPLWVRDEVCELCNKLKAKFSGELISEC